MPEKIIIGNKIINKNSPVFVIAEIGLNHNGKLEIAKKLIEAAKESGADAVKFQTYKTENFVHPIYGKTQYEILKKYELSFEKFKELKEFADKIGIIFLSSPFDFESVDFLYKIGVKAFKIASSELSNLYFVKYISSKELPMFISTGLHNYYEIKKSLTQIEKINKKIILLHCISEYPLSFENANLNSIPFLNEKFGYIVGFSDHSDGFILDIIAVSLGAKVIEKHFTLSRKLQGPDHKISLEPSELKEMIKNIRIVEKALGKFGKGITKKEQQIKNLALKGIYAAKDIEKGEIITFEKIKLLRPKIRRNLILEKILGKSSFRRVKRMEPF